ncbi:MAG: class I SAM-dependent methyltransferase [Candidatus Aminicenantes bacterium]|nr:class I SAM-dependent methyltransferase [Candidatus Aminicenantes bacterium]
MSISNSHKEYYEIPEFWDKIFSHDPDEQIRISMVISAIPGDVQTVLETGCGNGAIINNISNQKKNIERIVGVDISKIALSHVKTEKFECNINELIFEDKSFDLVIASEVIEHLTFNDFIRGIKEIQRVANKYILISVPNDENLLVNSRMCQKCYCWFNPNYHMNSFDKQKLYHLFDNFEMVWVKEVGPVIKMKKYSKFAAARFHYLKKPIAKIGICPQCGFNYANRKEEYDIIGRKIKQTDPIKKKMRVCLDILTRLFFTKKINKKRWLLALYKRSYILKNKYN